MNPSLRKRHRYIWLFLAILIPLLFVLSILNIPQAAIQNTQEQEQVEQQPNSTNQNSIKDE